MSLANIAKGITETAFGPPLEIGMTTKHPDGRTVRIRDGAFFVVGIDRISRVSNFWYWNEVLEDGSLGPSEHGYGWSL